MGVIKYSLMFIKIRLVPRIRLTGGGYAKQPFSKSKHPRKSPPKREFINIGGEIAVLYNTAFLYEKDLNSGAFPKSIKTKNVWISYVHLVVR